MKRHLILAIGLLSTILGLTVLVDAALADGCCSCCCCSNPTPTQESSDTTACANDVFTCNSYNNNQGNCNNNSFTDALRTFNVLNFPKCCISPSPPPSTSCVEVLANCSQLVTCTYKGTKCQPNSSTDPWQQATRPTTKTKGS